MQCQAKRLLAAIGSHNCSFSNNHNRSFNHSRNRSSDNSHSHSHSHNHGFHCNNSYSRSFTYLLVHEPSQKKCILQVCVPKLLLCVVVSHPDNSVAPTLNI